MPAGNDVVLPILLAQQQRKIYGNGVRKGDVVLDCGAHVGTYVKTALDAGASLVVAIEPSPPALECLRRNLEAEVKAGKVIIYPKGVWDKEEMLVMFDNGSGAAGDSFVTAGDGAKKMPGRPVTTIDNLARELNLSRVDFIKADVKGATERMLRGGAVTIRRDRPRMALSTEEGPEDPLTINNLVLTLSPLYKLRPGPCFFDGDEIRNEVIFFE
ncbi:MAG: FkbM family methyltransferase [Bryobacteraceae bacterium]